MEANKHVVHVERDGDLVYLWLDDPSRSVNTIGAEFPDRLEEALATVRQATGLRGLVVASRKSDFCVGADLELFRSARAPADAEALSRRFQRALDALAKLPVPTVAAIRGKCLGGGLELALACDLRVASEAPDCALAASEIRLGLCPGAGGTQRLVRQVGVEAGLEMLLAGRPVDARRAREIGLVDATAADEGVTPVAASLVRSGKPDAREDEPSIRDRVRATLLEGNPVGRRVLMSRARDLALQATHGNIPAVDRIIDAVATGLEEGIEAGLAAEARAFGELQASREARELIRLFFLARRLSHEPVSEARPRPIRRIGIVGAGTMGCGIAYVSARAGLRVRLRDRDDLTLSRALRRIHAATSTALERGEQTPFEQRLTMSRIGPTTTDSGFSRCPLVIEAVFEDLELKQKILREVEASATENVIFATTTSAIPIGRIAEGCAHPERVLGMHYFSPVHEVPLVELIAGQHTSPEALAICAALARRQGKKVIVVNDGVGFYTTRILAAYMMAGFELLGDGEPIDHIDGSLEAWGFPMGPIRIADEIGMELVLEIASSVRELGDRFALPAVVRSLQQAGFAGRSARRLYITRGEDTGPHPDVYARLDMEPQRRLDPEDIAWKCAGRMIDEAIRCLDQGVLRSADDGDAGAVFGLGFPAFRGGPFRVLEHLGPVELRDKLQRLGVACGQELLHRAEQREHPQRAPGRLVAHG